MEFEFESKDRELLAALRKEQRKDVNGVRKVEDGMDLEEPAIKVEETEGAALSRLKSHRVRLLLCKWESRLYGFLLGLVTRLQCECRGRPPILLEGTRPTS